MSFALGILRHTPWWVFALFALVTWSGIGGLRPRIVTLRQLVLIPAIFIVWGLMSLAQATLWLQASWCAAAAAGGAIAWMTDRIASASIDREKGTISMRGSAGPLVRNLSFFFARYAVGVASAVMPGAHDGMALLTRAVSGLSAGYFLGRMARLMEAYRRGSNPPGAVAT